MNRVEDETALIIRYQHEIAKLKADLEAAQREALRVTQKSGRMLGRPTPPTISKEDATANRELRNALKQAIANIGRVILNSQTTSTKKKKKKSLSRKKKAVVATRG